jgi:alkylated DNA repair dioxygenase AlkB
MQQETKPSSSSMPAIPLSPAFYVPSLQSATEAIDMAQLKQEFAEQDEFVLRKDFVPPADLAPLAQKARDLMPVVHRSKMGSYKKSGSISYYTLAEHAPEMIALYKDPALRAFFSELTGRELLLCPQTDPHACALYYYTEDGDHIGYHYDTSWYRGLRYTVLIALVNETSQSKLLCDLYRKDKERETVHQEVSTSPGTLVVFNGDNLWHGVSAIGEGETRIMMTLEYLTDPHMSAPKRWISNFKDAVAYFGFGGIKRKQSRARAD